MKWKRELMLIASFLTVFFLSTSIVTSQDRPDRDRYEQMISNLNSALVDVVMDEFYQLKPAALLELSRIASSKKRVTNYQASNRIHTATMLWIRKHLDEQDRDSVINEMRGSTNFSTKN